MKELKLISISMINFKGEKNRVTRFSPDVTTIAGRNGLGKSRHQDAFCWCLFGKDSQDRTDYKVLTHDSNGEELHKVNAEVEVVLNYDGRTIKLKRVYAEKWNTPKGTTQEVLNGHETTCFVDDVPTSVTEYKERVRSIIDEQTFKSLTNPSYFLEGREWKDQRAELFKMSGSASDAEIAKMRPEFEELWKRIGSRTFEQYRELILSRKKNAKTELNKQPVRIDQAYMMLPEEVNVDSINNRIKGIEEEIATLDDAMRSRVSLIDVQAEEYDAISRRKSELQGTLSDMLFEARRQEQIRCEEANSNRNKIIAEIRDIDAEIKSSEKTINRGNQSIESITDMLNTRNRMIDSIRERYDAENDKEFRNDDYCPFCNQRLPDVTVSENKAKFERQKNKKLDSLEAEGIENKRMIDQLNESLRKEQESLDEERKKVKDLENRRNLLSGAIDGIPVEEPKPVTPLTVPGYLDIKKQIDELGAKLEQGRPRVDNSDLLEKKKELLAKRDSLKEKLTTNGLREKQMLEIDKLKKQSEVLAQAVADCQREEDLMIAFYKLKVSLNEEKINSLFEDVTFRLSRVNLKGNEEECCEAYVNGIPYGTTNSAAKINAGLDIINAYCKHNDMTAPIFIDWAESINEIRQTYGQQIRLQVTDDHELTIY